MERVTEIQIETLDIYTRKEDSSWNLMKYLVLDQFDLMATGRTGPDGDRGRLLVVRAFDNGVLLSLGW